MTSLETLAQNVVWLEVRDGYPCKNRKQVKARLHEVIEAEYGTLSIFTFFQILYYVWKIWRLLKSKDFDAIDAYASRPSEKIREAFRNETL